ncbi:hypothetical protein HMPREF1987_00085 [Peptostreptococcaceae bacterium oral taxon 113 str. W5053]|nr:hypothetical protein HMPREF1987_00085 [Peptostreptococcaceae bacterium oral taxon 113 str. W5053]
MRFERISFDALIEKILVVKTYLFRESFKETENRISSLEVQIVS